MSRILFAWELGAGTGHLHSIGAVVAPLLKMGHEITLAVKNVVSARKVMGNLNVTMLASRTAGLPHFTPGTGFSLPPNRSPSPSLTPWIKTDPMRLQEGEKQALRTINSVLSAFDTKTLDSTADLFHQTPSFLLTLPELDHFGKRKDTAYWGNNISTEQTVLAWQAARQSLGVMASPDPAKHNYKNMIEKLLDTESYFETATRFAEHNRDNPLHKQDLIDKIHLEIEAIL